MSEFPLTSLTLLTKLAVQVTCERESAWQRFFELYHPAIYKFAQRHCASMDPDDVTQLVFLKLLRAMREQQYCADKSRFRSYLATIIRHEISTLYHKEVSRGLNVNVSIDRMTDEHFGQDNEEFHRMPGELVVSASQVAEIDLNWRIARHEAAIAHIMTKTAMNQKRKDIYREHVIRGRDARAVAKEFGVSRGYVGKVKFDIDAAISDIEKEFCDED